MAVLSCGVNVTVPCNSQLPLESWVVVTVIGFGSPDVNVPVGFSAALLAGLGVSTVAVIVTLLPRITFPGLATAVSVVG